jgi:2,3-dihydroxybenzoate-AMP ligase
MLPGCVAWPNDLAEKYRRDGYWRGEVLGEFLKQRSRTDGQRIALVANGSRWTYAELDSRVDRLAAGLRRLGLRPLDRVVIQLPNVAELVVLSIALFRLGALPVYALPAHRLSEIRYLCEYSGAVAYVTTDVFHGFAHLKLAEELHDRVPALKHILIVGDSGRFTALADIDDPADEIPAPDPGEVAFFLLSGGTTGMPKLIPRTHDDYAYQLRASAEALRVDENTVYLAGLPVAHNAALGCPGVLGTLRAGGKVVLAPSASPDDTFHLIRQEGVTLTTLMPPLVMLWMEFAPLAGIDLSGLLLQVGSAKFHLEVARQVKSVLGCRLTQWFGMAEGLLTYTRLDDPQDVILLTQGRPMCVADEIRVVDEAGHDVAPGEVGELQTRGPYTLRGYYDAEEQNARAFTVDGFLSTGDLVRITAAGNMIVEGRIKDVINRGGEKVSAEEVENQLLAHPNIRSVAVVAVPDEVMGEKTCACVIASGEAPKLREIKNFLRAQGLADYKLPDRLEVVDAFPRTSVGKVSKARLREVIAARLRAAKELGPER